MQNDTIPVWVITNGWREIFVRVFEHEETKLNVSPEWLVNPATHRRLKLDLLYPELGIAVRFEGLEGKQRRRRPSLEEEEQLQVRQDARVAICEAHGIYLIVVDLAADEPQAIFQQIDLALSQAGRRAIDQAQTDRIKRLRSTAAMLGRKISNLNDLKLYADLWQDRQYQPSKPASATSPSGPTVTFTAGMSVEHSIFGPGVVVKTTPSNGDTLITVDFITAGQKTLAASLVADKLQPR